MEEKASAAMDASVLYESDDEFQEKISHFVNVIKEDSDQFLHMLESMGSTLTHKEQDERVAGVRFITSVIQALPPKTLRKKEATTLLRYYVSKLEDHPSMVTFIVRGIYELVVNHEQADHSEIQCLLQAILYDVQMPGLVQAERYIIYRMLAHMLINNISALYSMGTTKFVLGCVQAIEGERDPRCLLQVFSIIPLLCSEFILGELEVPVFEVCACYFPVDFNPPSKEVGQITREELAEGLLNCLTATPNFGKYCVPLALEKLDSDLIQAKSDALKVLIRGAEVFPPACFIDRTVLIWKQIHSLVFVNRHEAIIPTALSCLTSVAKVISSHPKNPSALSALFKVAWKDLQEGAAPGMGQVLEAFAKASAEACSTVLVEALPGILKLLSKNDGLRQVLVLESTTSVLSLYASLCNHRYATQELRCQLGLLADVLCMLLTGGNHELALRAAAAYCAALPIHGFFACSQLEAIKHLLLRVATCQDAPSVRDEHISLLATAARVPGITDEVFSMLKIEIDKGYCPGKTERLLEVAAGSAGSFQALALIVPCVVERFVFAILGNEIVYRNLLARCLLEISCRAEKCGTSLCDARILRKVVEAWTDAVKDGHKDEALESFAPVAQVVQRLTEICSSGELRPIVHRVEESCVETSFANCSLLLLQCLICHTRPEAISANQRLVESLADAHTRAPSQLVAWCLAGYVNKLPSAALEGILRSLQPSFQPEWTLAKAEMVLWVTKALLLRGYPNLAPYTKLLEELLKDEKLGRRAAKGFQEILQPSVLTVEGHCTVQLMHQQRFFVETVDFLMEGFNGVTIKAVKDNFLMALCCQLAYVPKPVVSSYIDKVLPILVSALSSAEESVIGDSVLPCLTENVILMVSCLDSVLGQLLRLARPPFPMKVRQSALQCLLRLSTVDEKELLHYRQQVLHGLSECMADRKRLVRRVAAQVSLAWHMIGEPTGV